MVQKKHKENDMNQKESQAEKDLNHLKKWQKEEEEQAKSENPMWPMHAMLSAILTIAIIDYESRGNQNQALQQSEKKPDHETPTNRFKRALQEEKAITSEQPDEIEKENNNYSYK